MNRAVRFFIIGIMAVSVATMYGDGFAGLCGASLKEKIGMSYRPKRIVPLTGERGGVWEAFRQTDCDDNGAVVNRFSSEQPIYPSDGYSAAGTMQQLHIVAPVWWESTHDYRDTVTHDLHNIYPCSNDIYEVKRDQIPGYVTDVVFANEKLRVGRGELYGGIVDMWEPTEEFRGDFARVIFYMTTMYPMVMWNGTALNFLTDTKYPTLNRYAIQLLLDWHRNDPVCDLELQRNDAVEHIQGNRNPFVDNPDLVEYVWGEMKESPIMPDDDDSDGDKDDNDSDDNAEPEVRQPLKARYTIADGRIDLYSPFVPNDAVWSVDGTEVSSDCLVPADLGIGKHELRFDSGSRKGKLTIEIMQ